MNIKDQQYFSLLEKKDLKKPEVLDDIFSNNIALYSFLEKGWIDNELFSRIPEHLFQQEQFVISILKQYYPPINKIPRILLSNPFIQMNVATHAPFNLKYFPSDCLSQEFLSWYIHTQYQTSSYLSHLPKNILGINLAAAALNYDLQNTSFINQSYFDSLDFFNSLKINVKIHVFSRFSDEIQSNLELCENIIKNEASCYSDCKGDLLSKDSFTYLLSLNSGIFPYASHSIRSDFSCALQAIQSQHENILYCQENLLNDTEFFLAVVHTLEDKIMPYLQHFGDKIFTDKSCVTQILPYLLKSNKTHLIQEPLLSDVEFLKPLIIQEPSIYSYINNGLKNSLDFLYEVFTFIEYNHHLIPNDKNSHSIKKELYGFLPDVIYEDLYFLTDLYFNNASSFESDIWPKIINKNSIHIDDLKLAVGQGEKFYYYFSRIKHMFELSKKIKDSNASKKDENIKQKELQLKKI